MYMYMYIDTLDTIYFLHLQHLHTILYASTFTIYTFIYIFHTHMPHTHTIYICTFYVSRIYLIIEYTYYRHIGYTHVTYIHIHIHTYDKYIIEFLRYIISVIVLNYILT